MRHTGVPLHMTRRGGLATNPHMEATPRKPNARVEAESRMRRRVDLFPEAVFETDAAGRLVVLNGPSPCTAADGPEACRGRPLQDCVVEQDWSTAAAALCTERVSMPVLGPVVRVRRGDAERSWMALALVASSIDNLVAIADPCGRSERVDHLSDQDAARPAGLRRALKVRLQRVFCPLCAKILRSGRRTGLSVQAPCGWHEPWVMHRDDRMSASALWDPRPPDDLGMDARFARSRSPAP